MMPWADEWTPYPEEPVNEKIAARARLTGTHVVAVTDAAAAARKGADYAKAAERLAAFVTDADVKRWHQKGGPKKGFTVPEMLLEDCVKVLQDAPLTINIEPHKFFGSKVAGDKVQSIWNRLRSKAPGYGDARETAEQLMFAYDDGDQQVGGVNVGQAIRLYGGTQGLGADGQPRSGTFVADMRPKYAGVNFTWATCGAACAYGLSHFVLKSYLRLNAVFAPRDSFGVESRSQLGTYFNMYPVLAHCAEYVLAQILGSARNRVPPGAPSPVPQKPVMYYEQDKGGDNSKGSEYIEAILHTEVIFGRDVESLRIAHSEVKDTTSGDPSSGKIWTVKKTTIQKNIDAFAKQHNLRGALTYF
jgi:hypothetical protein